MQGNSLIFCGPARERTYEEKISDGVTLILDNHILAFVDYLCKTTHANWKFLRTGEKERGLNVCNLSIELKYDKSFLLRAELFSDKDPIVSIVIGGKIFNKSLYASDFECSRYCQSGSVLKKLEKLYWKLLAEKEGKVLRIRKQRKSDLGKCTKEKHEMELDTIREKVRVALKVEADSAERSSIGYDDYDDFDFITTEDDNDEEEDTDE
ncbi:MAG: hypothetical protein A3H69_01490 [Candidatus Sungbacteria bacterium RIFCSPLOWO2_02_FULL_47_9]|uniref:Uncharacterized protein n=1 Tax=Candidatus Sungbacteria bacterium RIFCSPHIGHO2_01_FULL_47_32 TaxID=1802264 RepID=A0A1G2K5H9_9BACT|nr:MAG: hypothetical protein UX72_C0009G0047 [Parcubacteria group bacterium GW2011_GWA2_47_10]OGZ94694.1 MAG: hypothetical protein A2633_02625 [Candidatus Sungbacteria bacterium RIFCSPHIGHO2_01_FULL_47_32]OGZ99543.1 MAG: hypothetical protein A3D57_00345 [Candidatus Sungbacteria bacterium RIFCSPHIGHO2_02_FULL_46_12]OHA05206.1 MAG: hypothetical protein A3A28_01960 [Candidatus Sungbacteria bacterium RIFCSPLOWO2_01_FULL_47_32]OHA11815.1 MAG: hypothetical protein A3H69_01490 [Candidatus Sungbacteria